MTCASDTSEMSVNVLGGSMTVETRCEAGVLKGSSLFTSYMTVDISHTVHDDVMKCHLTGSKIHSSGKLPDCESILTSSPTVVT